MFDAASPQALDGSVRLGDIATFVRGITFKPEDVVPASQAGSLLCMRTKNVQDKLDLSDVWGIPRSFARRADQLLREGDILISSANSWNLVGKCCWVPALESPATFGGFVTVLRADPHRAHARYLYRWLSSDPIQATLRSFGRKTTSISNLDLGRTLDLTLNLPSLEDQRRIAAILDEADALRTKRQAALAQLDEMAVSLFMERFVRSNDTLSWPQVAIGAIARTMRTGPFGSQLLHSEFVDEGVAVLGIDNAVRNVFAWDERRYITEEKYKQLARYRVYPRDVIVTIMGTCGRAAIVPDDIPLAITTKHLCSITLDHKVCLSDYLHACFLTHPAVLRQLGVTARGAVMPGLNMGLIKETVIPLPPIAVQQEFCRQLHALNDSRQTAESAAVQNDSLFSSLQHRAFRGEL
ncbi:restriction endonuclease subunit S [Muricoccus radiodurans]|uniref:restriction endonuclease subunit S n=1 Tax=Muricoccus radiodurans TaxID=2231721 RepID=UPI003CFAEF52